MPTNKRKKPAVPRRPRRPATTDPVQEAVSRTIRQRRRDALRNGEPPEEITDAHIDFAVDVGNTTLTVVRRAFDRLDQQMASLALDDPHRLGMQHAVDEMRRFIHPRDPRHCRRGECRLVEGHEGPCQA